jgi:hypothetical protein
MSLSPLYITFGQHQVVIETVVLEVHTTVKQWFYAMLEPQPSVIVRKVTISQSEGNYIIQSGEKMHETIREKMCLLQAVKYEVIMALINSRLDLLWFHAGAVANDTEAVVFAAPGGGGKSTLIAHLCQQGWRYLSDDVVPLELSTRNILPFPQTPRVRQNTGKLVPSDRLWEVPKRDVTLGLGLICRSPLPIRALVFPSFDQQTSAQLSPCTPGFAALELLHNCINFTDHKQIALQQICEIVKHLPAFKLKFSNIECALKCIAQIQSFKNHLAGKKLD